MKDERLVVSNTSPLLNLALIGRLDLIDDQFSTVTVPSQVWDELMAGSEGVETLQTYRDAGTIHVVPVLESELLVEFRRELDIGEAATLAYAIEEDSSLVLLDEREGRKAARRHSLAVTGAIGVLLRGANDGDVDLESELDALRDAGFWISDSLYQEVLKRSRSDTK